MNFKCQSSNVKGMPKFKRRHFDNFDGFVIPAPYQVRGKLQPESSFFHGVANTLDPGFHRGDEYSAIFSQLQGDERGFDVWTSGLI